MHSEPVLTHLDMGKELEIRAFLSDEGKLPSGHVNITERYRVDSINNTIN